MIVRRSLLPGVVSSLECHAWTCMKSNCPPNLCVGWVTKLPETESHDNEKNFLGVNTDELLARPYSRHAPS